MQKKRKGQSQTNRSKPDFEPSIKTLLRIMKTMTENGSAGKTRLSLDTNLNYSRLSKHVKWLEKKGLVESIVKDGKVKIALTRNGRTFASILSKV